MSGSLFLYYHLKSVTNFGKKKCNKLDEYIYTYFIIILIITLNNFFLYKDCC